MPSYNASAWVGEAIDSILTQNYPSIELWVIDGGSTDGTVEWLSAAANRDKRLRWRSEPDRGAAEAVNKGLREARGTVIGWLNADDRYAPGAIGRAVERLDGPDEPVLVYGEALQIDEYGKALGPYPTRRPPINSLDFLESCFICQPTAFFRRSLTVTVGLLDESLQTAFDFEYWLRVFRGHHDRIAYLSALQAYSRWHPAALSARLRATVAVEALTILRRHLGRAPLHWALTYLLELNKNTPVDRVALIRFSKLVESLLTEADFLEYERALTGLFA